MTFKDWCKKSWWFLLGIVILIVNPFIFWWIGQYYIAISNGLISWLGAIVLFATFLSSWHSIKKTCNVCKKDADDFNK